VNRYGHASGRVGCEAQCVDDVGVDGQSGDSGDRSAGSFSDTECFPHLQLIVVAWHGKDLCIATDAFHSLPLYLRGDLLHLCVESVHLEAGGPATSSLSSVPIHRERGEGICAARGWRLTFLSDGVEIRKGKLGSRRVRYPVDVAKTFSDSF